MIFKDNITFALLNQPANWRADLTARFASYWAHRFGGNVVDCQTSDEALNSCNTDYLIIQSAGSILFNEDFFVQLEAVLSKNSDIVIGHPEIDDEYVKLNDRLMIFNMSLWRKIGQPSFITSVNNGPAFNILEYSGNKLFPLELELQASGDRSYIQKTNANGAGILVKQLELFGKITALPKLISRDAYYYLDKQTPYHEIHCETLFQKKYVEASDKKIKLNDFDFITEATVKSNILVCAASGLRAINLVEKINPVELVIFDKNPLALEFQRALFSVETPSLYGEIVEQFKLDNPDAEFDGELLTEQYTVIQTHKNLKISYVLADPLTYQIEDLIKSLDNKASMTFDLGDIFVLPTQFFKKLLYQVQALFAEVYSLLKSRHGPTTVFGLSPQFEQMDDVKINTFVNNVSPGDEPTQFYIPRKDDAIEEVFNTNTALVEQDVKELVEPSHPQVMALAQIVQPTVIIQQDDNTAFMTGQGYNINITGNKIKYTKEEQLSEFHAIYEYSYSTDNSWAFYAGKFGSEKRIELMNGRDRQTFLKHVLMPVKFNAKTMDKYF